MGLYFKNSRSQPIWVVIGYPSHGCEGGVDYAKKGWWRIAPGAEAKVYTGWVGGDAWFWYAETDDGHTTWSGNYRTDVHLHRFDLCWNIGVGGAARRLGFRRKRIDWDIMDYTFKL
jgi:hypothetical protein